MASPSCCRDHRRSIGRLTWNHCLAGRFLISSSCVSRFSACTHDDKPHHVSQARRGSASKSRQQMKLLRLRT